MPSMMIMHRLCLSLFVLTVWSGAAFAAEKTVRYSNNQFGFSFQYPASWVLAHTAVRDIRVKVVASEGEPAGECVVLIKEYPKAEKARQSDIDEVFLTPPTVDELQEMLGHEGEHLQVNGASTGKLGQRPAHVARYQMKLGFDEYLSGKVSMTATPGLTWSVSCSGRGGNQEEAEKSFQAWQRSIQALLNSFTFKQ